MMNEEDLGDLDLALILVALLSFQQQLHLLDYEISTVASQLKREEYKRVWKRHSRSQDKANTQGKSNQLWHDIFDRTADPIFRRKFRLSKTSFIALCKRINEVVGPKEFRPANSANQSKFTCGEIRVAVGLRILAGGSYLDLFQSSYGVDSSKTVYAYFHTLIKWINKSFSFPLVAELRKFEDSNKSTFLAKKAAEFALDSEGVFYGVIGALDGLAVRIQQPASKEIPDPGNYFCRKKFFALNVQAICDRSRRFLWVSTGHKGSSHDSTAFQDTRLASYLEELEPKLSKAGFFIVGDSAYPLSPFMIVPFPDAVPGSMEDSFNYWQSNSRIRVECAFGELIQRWGLFWRTLRFSIKVCDNIIKAAMLLNNHIIDQEEDKEADQAFFQSFPLSLEVSRFRFPPPHPSQLSGRFV